MAEHEGATERWSPRAELAEAGQSPDLRTVRPEREAAAELRTDLAAWETRQLNALDAVVAQALARLGRAGS